MEKHTILPDSGNATGIFLKIPFFKKKSIFENVLEIFLIFFKKIDIFLYLFDLFWKFEVQRFFKEVSHELRFPKS